MSFLRPRDLVADIDPFVPKQHFASIARELDRQANLALNSGRALWAAKASRRAAELREIARKAAER